MTFNRKVGAASLVVIAVLAASSCSTEREAAKKRITPEYDKNGKLQLLKYDSKGSGIVDTWSYMDGARVVRIEIDSDEDGKIERWEHYDAAQKLEKVGMSLPNDGQEDAWSYAGPDGSINRIDVSTRRDGKITRVEHYEKSVLVRAEEDSDGDSQPDKWETYQDGSLTSVAFDTTHRGAADRRLIYGADGSARLEMDAAGNGHFVAAGAPATRTVSARR